jgi:xanthine dehydrogenase accessory factor
MRELELWKFIARELRARHGVVLLVVVESTGSSPGRVGFKMAVSSGGALHGSIGGGVMEYKLVELAKDRLRADDADSLPAVKRQIHRQDAARDRSGMICSGEQTVALLPLHGDQLPTVRRIARALQAGRPGVLQLSAQTLAFQAGEKNAAPCRFERAGDQDFLYEENLGFRYVLHLIGAGHCALALAELLARLDFYIRLYDDRPHLNTFERNRFAHEKRLVESYERIGDYVEAGREVFVVVMTLGYRSDAVVLRQLLDREFAYFGVLGSAAKMDVLLRELAGEGFPAEQLRRLRTPIGLPINSRTPEEIAVSIAAEIIAVKNAKSATG